ncbi:hypothetical protein KEJ17_06125 [Candidatus Bathyarchaeota archaeon]|nr:hypothetical protein [Candidatus Bathyarchaeota archaeon]
MGEAKVFREEATENGIRLSAIVIELGNSYLVLLSEGEEDNLGTLSVSILTKPEISRMPISSTLLGERNVIIARSIAERFAAATGKMALVSVFVKTLDEARAGQVFVRLLEKILRRRREA